MNGRDNPRSVDDWLALLESRHHKRIDLGLDRCREVWQRMGSPWPAARIFVVAGTNGKGSVCATLTSLLGNLGHRCGSYTTPHLLRYNERVQIAGHAVSDDELLRSFEAVEAARSKVSLTYFEFGTLSAFWILARAGLDFAVMEVGLGGRLDAVNLLDADCAVITPVGLDHQEFLGPDRESIGYEKAGIIRSGRPVVCGDAEPPASVLAVAQEQGAPVFRGDRDFRLVHDADTVRFYMGDADLRLPPPVLAGAHQLQNLGTALAALLQVLPEAAEERAALARGVAAVRLPGRLQRAASRPPVWIDVGHNALAATALAAALPGLLAATGASRCHCVIAMLADKDAAAVALELRGVISHWYCAGLPGERGQSGRELASQLGRVAGPGAVSAHDSVAVALETVLESCGPGEAVLVFGSFLTAAAALDYCRARCGDSPGGC